MRFNPAPAAGMNGSVTCPPRSQSRRRSDFWRNEPTNEVKGWNSEGLLPECFVGRVKHNMGLV